MGISVIIYFMKKILSVLLCVLLVFSLAGCGGMNLNSKEKFTSSFLDLFDTASTIIAYDDSQAAFDEHIEQFHSRLEEYDKLYDIYNSYEGVVNLCTLNKEAKDGPVQVDSRIIDLLEYCKYVYNLSGGKTNICFGSVLRLWHYSRDNANDNPAEAALPDMAQLKSAAEHTSIDSLVIDKENSTVYFSDPDLKLDVGAVAKGYAVREITNWAKENLWTSAAISIGGNVSTFGYKNDDGKTLWNIGIENPDRDAADYLVNVKITDLSVVTSGDYQRYFVVDNKKYCHIINPETLMPAEYTSGVSVICSDSALGDALSTTLFNMPVDEGQRLVEGMDGVEAVWVDKDYNSTFSSGFEKYILND